MPSERLTCALAQSHIAAGMELCRDVVVSESPLEKLREGTLPAEEDSFGVFVREHQPELLRFFQGRVSQNQDAADLAQESWTRLMRYRGQQPPEALRNLLFSIARNLLNNHWRWTRLRQIEQPTDFSGFDVASEMPNQERELHGQHSLQRLEAAVAALPPKCRTVFLLSRVEGLSNGEIARRCGVSVKMVEKHLARALMKCRAQVGDWGA
ncbi:RNA polymerase sigma factor [Luteimonas aquatica]|uniref:RNA polymerase sigma factor n=1 Tax=Luteimonas aquatica TaxID=450364 RepID=UPI001F5957E4|nr:RNA polymerase sigma factor [Luteimonas aquatica]